MKLTRNPVYKYPSGDNTHQPKRPFFKLATTALLAGLCLASMALPKQAAAQEVKPATDTTIKVVKPATDTTVQAVKPVTDTSAQIAIPLGTGIEAFNRLDSLGTYVSYAKPTMDTMAQSAKLVTPAHTPKLTGFSLLRFKSMLNISINPIDKMQNVPPEICHVPVHPDDIWKGHSSGLDTSWSQPMYSTIRFPSYVNCCALEIGPGLSFNDHKFEIEVGAGAFISFFTRKLHERNYLKDDKPFAGELHDYERDVGTALTWYTVLPRYGLKSPSFLGVWPYLSAEARLGLPRNCVVGLGCRLSSEEFTSTSGWDRYDRYQVSKKFKLVDMTVCAPYLLFGGSIPEESASFYYYFGTRHIIKKQVSDLAKQANLVFRDFTCTFGLGMVGTLWPQQPRKE